MFEAASFSIYYGHAAMAVVDESEDRPSEAAYGGDRSRCVLKGISKTNAWHNET